MQGGIGVCFDRRIFLNNRTTKDGYIKAEQSAAHLSSTRLTDLKLAIRYLKCRYDFGIEEITEFLGISTELVEETFNDLPCLTCSSEKRERINNKARKMALVQQPEEAEFIVKPKKRKALAAR